jgi:quercetin dioxygenase-like cupin family protein
MKTVLALFLGGMFLSLIFASGINAQDWKNANPDMNKILVDTTLIRAELVTLEPGQKSAVHTHPAHFFYALTAGKLLVNYTDGTSETYDLMVGDSGYSNPEKPHTTTNVGKAEIKFLLVELKEHPYKAPK